MASPLQREKRFSAPRDKPRICFLSNRLNPPGCANSLPPNSQVSVGVLPKALTQNDV